MRIGLASPMCLCLVFQSLALAGPSAVVDWSRVPGLAAGDYKPEFLNRAAEVLAEVHCYGHCSDSIADCLKRDPIPNTAQQLASDVVLLMAGDASLKEIERWVSLRERSAHPAKEDIRNIRLEGLTSLGEATAPVVLVEYSDFECPFCAQVSPLLERVSRESQGRARLYFKQFPIKGHPHALAAAKACVAADSFGKFWEYCPRLFEHRTDLTDERFRRLAIQSGIPVEEFESRRNSAAVLNRIADEKMEGLRNRIDGTPAVFINGKELLLPATYKLVRNRVQEELNIQQGVD